MKKSIYERWAMAPFIGTRIELQRLDLDCQPQSVLNFTEEHLLNLPRTMLPARPPVCLDELTLNMGSLTNQGRRMSVTNYCFLNRSAN